MLHPSYAPRLDRGSVITLSRVRLRFLATILLLSVIANATHLGLSPYASLLTLVWLVVQGVQDRLFRNANDPARLELLAFASLCADAVVITGVVAFTGGIWWCGTILYAILTVATASMMPRKRIVAVCSVAILSLAVVLVLQVRGILPSSQFLHAPTMVGAWTATIAGVVVVATEMLGLGYTQYHLTVMLRQRAMRYRTLMDTASDLVLVLTHEGNVTHVNRAALLLAQCERRDMIRDGLERLLVTEDVAFFRSRLRRALGGETQTMMLRAQAFHGIRWLSCTLAPMVPGLQTTNVLAIFRDVTDDRLAADTVRHSEARLRAVFNQAAIAIALLDLDGFFTEVNPAVERLLGYDGAGLIGRPWNALSPPEDFEETQRMITALKSQERENVTIEQRFVRQDGRVLWTLMTISRVDNPSGAAGLIAMLQDITERRALEAQLTWQAYHDPLTNLANRALFRERVDRALQHRSGTPGSVAVLFLDLDNFKTINDSMGHAAGDQLLFEVGRRLLNATRGCDTVARLGGDEFAILIDNVKSACDCVRVADRVLESMLQPVQLDGADVTVSSSIGIVRDAGDETADDILRNADVAMYNAKQRGKGRHSLFEPGMHDKAVERMRLTTELRTAIENDEITLWFQPIVTLEDSRPCGFEALARWTHAEFGQVPPSTFIPLAEETGMIVPLGCAILREACRQAVLWNAIPGLTSPIGLTVNLSGRQLEETTVVGHVRDALEESGLDPARLTLEITETALVHNSETMRERLFQLKDLGVSLAIDDFGTGYSSLSYIQQFPVDVLKIDRSFVEGLGRSTGTDAALARTIIALGASLQLRTIAEGIEVETQRAILLQLGCEFGQGYLYARPMLAADLHPWLADALGLTRPLALPSSGSGALRVTARPRRNTDELERISA
ncbi:MAG TPA: EAL domain-containing protein [Gemmatimonadaceae bacterium]|nr:EAL domain-containing protein [Gemmatimonadaceae bacterium]